MIRKRLLEIDTVQYHNYQQKILWVLFWKTQDSPWKSSKFTTSAKSTAVNYKWQNQKTKKFVPKLWASCNDQMGAPKHHQQPKWLIVDRSNWKLRNQHWKYKPKSLTKKNMVKLVLQNKQISILKSHKFASNIKKIVEKSPKTWSNFYKTFWLYRTLCKCTKHSKYYIFQFQ